MRILIGTIPRKIKGGVYATENPFEKALMRQDQTEVAVLNFGSKNESETIIEKVYGRFFNAILFAFYIIKFKPDIIHLNSAFVQKALLRDVMYVLISKLFRRRLFIKYHGSLSYLLLTKSLIWKTLTRICVNLSSGIGVLSCEEKENFVRAGYPGGHFFVVPNSIDCQRFAGAVKKKALMKDILFISRFLPSKGLIDVIRAVKIVLDSGKTVRLVCVGDGPQMQEAQSIVNELRIQQHVKFEGFVTEDKTTAYYLNSDMLVFPTTHGEGFSMVIFQSVASGLPIITTRIRAAADYLKEPDNCIWTKPGNPEMLAQKICYILDQPEIALKMADNNRNLAQRFSPDKVALEYLKLYNHLLRN